MSRSPTPRAVSPRRLKWDDVERGLSVCLYGGDNEFQLCACIVGLVIPASEWNKINQMGILLPLRLLDRE